MNDELDIEAAEYVLGTLPADERARFAERLEARRRRCATRCGRWQARLVAARRRGRAPRRRRPTCGARIEAATLGGAPGRAGIAARLGNVVRLRRRLAVWRGATLVAGALAAGARRHRGDRPRRAAAGRRRAAATSRSSIPSGREPALIAEVDTSTGIIRVRSLAAETPAGQQPGALARRGRARAALARRAAGRRSTRRPSRTWRPSGRPVGGMHRRHRRAGGRLAVRRADRAGRLYRAAHSGR